MDQLQEQNDNKGKDGSTHLDGCKTLRARIVRVIEEPEEDGRLSVGASYWRRRATSGDEGEEVDNFSRLKASKFGSTKSLVNTNKYVPKQIPPYVSKVRPQIAAQFSVRPSQTSVANTKPSSSKSSSLSSSSTSGLSDVSVDEEAAVLDSKPPLPKLRDPRTALWRRRYVERIADPSQKSKIFPSRLTLAKNRLNTAATAGLPTTSASGPKLETQRSRDAPLSQLTAPLCYNVLKSVKEKEALAKTLSDESSKTDEDAGAPDRRVSTQSSDSNGSDSSGYCSGVEISPSDRLQNLMQRAYGVPRPAWKLRLLKMMGNEVHEQFVLLHPDGNEQNS